MRVALAAVVVVAAVLLGAALFGGRPNVGGGPEITPTPTPSASTSLSSYLITNEEGVRVTLTLSAGWTRRGWYVQGGTTTDDSSLMGLQIWAVGDVYTDPCHWQGAIVDPPVGPTVDDLAQALANQLTREATTSDVTLDGYTGSLVNMSVPADIRFSDCDASEFRSWVAPSSPDDARYHQDPGQLDDVYILDVDGFRLVIDALYRPETTAERRAEIQQMLNTIQIEPPA